MFPAGQLVTFALISFALIIVPGPNVLFVISRSLMLGRAAGVSTAVGGVIGECLQVVAVAFGVGALVERSVAIYTVIKRACHDRHRRQPGAHRPQGLTAPARNPVRGQHPPGPPDHLTRDRLTRDRGRAHRLRRPAGRPAAAKMTGGRILLIAR